MKLVLKETHSVTHFILMESDSKPGGIKNFKKGIRQSLLNKIFNNINEIFVDIDNVVVVYKFYEQNMRPEYAMTEFTLIATVFYKNETDIIQ